MEKLSMDLNSQPDTVWMCLREEGRLVQKSQLLFRRILSDEEYVKLVGVRTGEKIFIYPYDWPEFNGGLIPLIFISHHRTIRVDGHFDNVLVVSRVSKTD